MGGTLIAIGLLSRQSTGHHAFPFGNREDWINWIGPIRLMSLMRSAGGAKSLQEDDLAAVEAVCRSAPDVAHAARELFPHALSQIQSNGTTHISIMDGEGNEIAMTTSNGTGSAIIPEGTGFMLNNMLGEDDLQPSGLGTWKPDSRLSSMMAPTLAHLSDGTRLATGSGGSNRIRSTILQILSHLIDRNIPVEEAVNAPRLHWESGDLHVEWEAAEKLAQLDAPLPWPIISHPFPNLYFGGAHSVAHSPAGGFSGIGDPRRGGTVLKA
jgi:gamma-glutamyltranspeptidase/glutathione hydrolase